MSEYQLAEALGKFKWEIEQLPCDEVDGWWEYFKWKNKQTEKISKKAASKNSGKGSKRTTTI